MIRETIFENRFMHAVETDSDWAPTFASKAIPRFVKGVAGLDGAAR
jgi:UDP-N-acetylglucosamine enolpyruvyl transferase